jgi:uroporphyrin-III C-methyltransferase/precorrin-2 dehydrogenase/sirohydrochlorin ferrochelatase
VNLAKQGKRVVRLKGGDPLIFGRAGEELDACRAANISVEVVPGITAAQGAAAKLALPLTDRKHARRLQYVTGHAKDGQLPADLDWRSLADPATTTAIYCQRAPCASREGRCRGLDPRTPACDYRATRPDQAVVEATIAGFRNSLHKRTFPDQCS